MNENFNEQYYMTPGQQPKKKGKAGMVVALAAVIAIVGGASGFGGAYLAGMARDMLPNPGSVFSDALPENSGSHNAVPENGQNNKNGYEGAANVPGDTASAINSIYASTGASSDDSGRDSSGAVIPTGPNGTYTASELYEAEDDTIVLINIYRSISNSQAGYYDYYFGYGDRYEEKDSEPIFVGYGSGIVFTEDGYILTNAHITDDADRLEVVVNDYYDSGTTHSYEAQVVGSDTDTDIAIVKITRDEPFKAAVIGDSDTLKVGQDVCAIGNPGVDGTIMFPHTLTKGVVSGINRVSLSTGYTTSSIQIDAAINGGNSGGALFDMYGKVVGVVNKKIIVDNIENLGFAITINEAKPIMEDLITYGKVMNRPVLGIITSELNEYRAQLYGTKLTKGLLVTSINENAAAIRSGLRINDIITKINGTNVETVKDVQSIIKHMKAGDKITATVARETEDGRVESVDVEIELSSSSINN